MAENEVKLPIIGGIFAAIGASICCAGPLVLLLLGISGSWISNLTLLEPYRPYFLAAVLALFVYAGWKVYRPVDECDPGAACAVPQVRKRRQIIFWVTALLAIVLITSNYWLLWFLD
jgi:mercuric ion transport protein